MNSNISSKEVLELQKELFEMEKKNAKLEKNFQGACRVADKVVKNNKDLTNQVAQRADGRLLITDFSSKMEAANLRNSELSRENEALKHEVIFLTRRAELQQRQQPHQSMQLQYPPMQQQQTAAPVHSVRMMQPRQMPTVESREDDQGKDQKKRAAPKLLDANAIRLNDAVLGSGHFGQVVKGVTSIEGGEKKGGEQVEIAVKKIMVEREEAKKGARKMQKARRDLWTSEGMMMGSLKNNENIVQYWGMVQSPNDVMLVLERLESNLPDFFQHKKASRQLKSFFAHCISAGLAYLHGEKIIHRDISLRNILMDLRTVAVKIGDFGMAVRGEEVVGGPKPPMSWQSPEVITSCRFSAASDVYAFGVTLWELSKSGMKPYAGMEDKEIKGLVVVAEPLSPTVFSTTSTRWRIGSSTSN